MEIYSLLMGAERTVRFALVNYDRNMFFYKGSIEIAKVLGFSCYGDLLKHLRGPDNSDTIAKMRMLAGPHGHAYYKAIKAKHET